MDEPQAWQEQGHVLGHRLDDAPGDVEGAAGLRCNI